MPANKNTDSDTSRGRGRIIFPLLLLVLAAAGAWYWNTRKIEPVLSGEGAQVKSTLHLETFILNLADSSPGQRSYLRVGIDLGLGRGLSRGETAPVAAVRDTILGVLAQARVDDLLTEKGKTKLKADLLHALQERMPGLEVEAVYYTEFLIQR